MRNALDLQTKKQRISEVFACYKLAVCSREQCFGNS